jgi:hypothetical protein
MTYLKTSSIPISFMMALIMVDFLLHFTYKGFLASFNNNASLKPHAPHMLLSSPLQLLDIAPNEL